jgi:hypothetical protein
MLERAEYAMTSMQDVRRLIREHGWAVLVVGRSGELQAAHVPACSIPCTTREAPASSSSSGIRYGRIPSSRRCAPGNRCCSSSRAPTGTSHPPGTARAHPRQPGTHRRPRPRDPRGPRRRGGVLGPGAHGRAPRGRPGRPLGAGRGRAGLRTADRTRDGSLSGPLGSHPGQGEAEPGQAAPDPGPRDRGARRGRPVPEPAARRRNATRPRASAWTAAPTKDQVGAPAEPAR